MRLVLVQLRAEVRRVAGNGEQLLLTLGIPVLLLVFFSAVDVLPTGTKEPIDFLAPGILALAMMSTAMVSLGIATGFERSYHVLKRLGATPLGRPRLIAAKIGSVIAIEVVQFAVLIPVAYLLGWNPPSPNWLLAVARRRRRHDGVRRHRADPRRHAAWRDQPRRAERAVPRAAAARRHGHPVRQAPRRASRVAHALPSGALADVLREALSDAGTQPARSWIVLCVWAVVTPLLASRLFRWD